MNVTEILAGYAISVIGGAIVLWVTIDKCAWGYLERKNITGKKPGILTVPMGVVERLLYTTAFLVNQPGFIAVWLALKVASHWKRWEGEGEGEERATYNVFLIGSGLSLIMAFLGAWVAAGHIPLKNEKSSNVATTDLWERSKMADEIIKELWEIKDGIARQHGYDIEALVDHLHARKRPGGQRVVDLRAMRKTTEQDTPTDAAKPRR